MTWSFGTIPGGRVANDVAAATVAGYTFAWAGVTGGAAGGLLNVRVALRGSGLADLGRALARIEGVRVTSGPATSGACVIVHCAGFKMVLSPAAPGSDSATGLVSRTSAPALSVSSALATALDGLMRATSGRAAAPAAPAAAPAASETSTLKRTPLRPGKTLTRKAPLARRTPLRRGPKEPKAPKVPQDPEAS